MVHSSHNFSSDSRIDSFVRSAAPGCTHAEQIESRSSLQPCAISGQLTRYTTAERCEDNEGLWVQALIVQQVVVAMEPSSVSLSVGRLSSMRIVQSRCGAGLFMF